MAYGVVCPGGITVKLERVDCSASVTDRFGVFTLRHYYRNVQKEQVSAEYIFPVDAGTTVAEFNAYTGNRHIFSAIEEKQTDRASSGSNFSVDLGSILPDQTVITEIKYTREISGGKQQRSIVIPTLSERRYITLGRQIAFGSYGREQDFTFNVNAVYHGLDITEVSSPTHSITSKIIGNKATADIFQENCSDGEAVINIFVNNGRKYRVYKFNDVISCSVTPDFDLYCRRKRDYMFMVDITDKNKGWKTEQMKTAMLLSVKGLQKGDRFNAVILKKTPRFLCDEFLPVTEETVNVLCDWIDKADFSARPQFYSTFKSLYKTREACTAILFSDGGAEESADVLKLVRDKVGISYYTFCADCSNGDFLSRLAQITGGRHRKIELSERIDDCLIKNFNIISSPSMNKIGFAFNESVENLIPRRIWGVHKGDDITVMGRVTGNLPSLLKINGRIGEEDDTFEVPFDNIVEAGEELEYLYNTGVVKMMADGLNYDGKTRDRITLEKISGFCVDKQIYCKYVSFAVSENEKASRQYINVDLSGNNYSKGWYKAEDRIESRYLKRTKEEQYFIDIALTQKANGSFLPQHASEQDDAALYTAKIMCDFFEGCPDVGFYIWQMRKAVIFLLDFIEFAEYKQIPGIIMSAIEAWYESMGGKKDKISQKAETLLFLHKQK